MPNVTITTYDGDIIVTNADTQVPQNNVVTWHAVNVNAIVKILKDGVFRNSWSFDFLEAEDFFEIPAGQSRSVVAAGSAGPYEYEVKGGEKPLNPRPRIIIY